MQQAWLHPAEGSRWIVYVGGGEAVRHAGLHPTRSPRWTVYELGGLDGTAKATTCWLLGGADKARALLCRGGRVQLYRGGGGGLQAPSLARYANRLAYKIGATLTLEETSPLHNLLKFFDTHTGDHAIDAKQWVAYARAWILQKFAWDTKQTEICYLHCKSVGHQAKAHCQKANNFPEMPGKQKCILSAPELGTPSKSTLIKSCSGHQACTSSQLPPWDTK